MLCDAGGDSLGVQRAVDLEQEPSTICSREASTQRSSSERS
jgi:hypothetical protein